MEGIKYPKDLLDVNPRDKSLYLTYNKVEIGMAAQKDLKDAKVSDLQSMQFREQFKTFVTSTITKLLTKAPVTYKIVRYLGCLNPSSIVASPEKAASNFKELLRILGEAGRVTLADCDKFLHDWKDMLDHICQDQYLREKFVDFRYETNRLDEFLATHMMPLSSSVWGIVKMLLLLSHGQASVERGVSFNKELICENLKEQSLVAQRRIIDFLNVHGGTKNVPITKHLLDAAHMGRQNYQFYLDSQREKKEKQEGERKRKRAEEEIDALRAKKKPNWQERKRNYWPLPKSVQKVQKRERTLT